MKAYEEAIQEMAGLKAQEQALTSMIARAQNDGMNVDPFVSHRNMIRVQLSTLRDAISFIYEVDWRQVERDFNALKTEDA